MFLKCELQSHYLSLSESMLLIGKQQSTWYLIRCHTKFCVMMHSRKARKPGLDWVQLLHIVHRYTKIDMASNFSPCCSYIFVVEKGGLLKERQGRMLS